jgi:lysozyme family protein
MNTKYYYPYPIALEIILISLIGVLFGIVFSTQQVNQPATNNQSNQAIALSGNDEFSRAMPHILKWEGKCSDHPRDPGGRTYMGITRYEAKRAGFDDPCTMTKEQVLKVYRDRYWVRVPQSLQFPEKLVYFNLIINGTKGRCLREKTALLMLDCQENHYKSLRNFTYFGDGWINRNNYFKKIVSGQ